MTNKQAIIMQAVRAIEYDILDRHGLGDEWERIDEAAQVAIRNKWFAIVEQAVNVFGSNER